MGATAVEIDVYDGYFDFLADCKAFLIAFEQESFGDKLKFAVESFDRDKTFDCVGEFRKQAERSNARNDGGVFFANFFAHIHRRVKRVNFAFRFRCATFSIRRLQGDFFDFVAVQFARLRVFAVDDFFDDAVDAKVGVTADRGSEVAISFAR